MIYALLLLLLLLQKLQKGAQWTKNSDSGQSPPSTWPRKAPNFTPLASPLPPTAGSSAQTCLCPCCPPAYALHFPANPLGSIRLFQVALKGLWEAVPGIPRLWGKRCPQCLIPRAPTTSVVTSLVAEPSLFLYPLALLCALVAPRCLQDLPRLFPPGSVFSPLPLEMLPEGTSHLVCSLFLPGL